MGRMVYSLLRVVQGFIPSAVGKSAGHGKVVVCEYFFRV